MTFDGTVARLSLGSLLAKALGVARHRWATLGILLVSLDWGPHVFMGLSGGHRYDPASHDAASFAAYGFQAVALAFCDMMMQASVIVVGLGGLRRPVSASAAIWRILRRLLALAPWWLLAALPMAVTLWIRWASVSYADVNGTYVWRELGSNLFDIVLSCALGLFPLVVLAENLSGVSALRRTWRLMNGRRGTVFAVALATDLVGMLINLAIPYLTYTADTALGRAAWFVAAYGSIFAWEAQAVIANLVYVELYRELARAHDGIAPGELAHIFA